MFVVVYPENNGYIAAYTIRQDAEYYISNLKKFANLSGLRIIESEIDKDPGMTHISQFISISMDRNGNIDVQESKISDLSMPGKTRIFCSGVKTNNDDSNIIIYARFYIYALTKEDLIKMYSDQAKYMSGYVCDCVVKLANGIELKSYSEYKENA